ncbi:collagen-like protein, partial [Streptomyces sp900116325]
VDGVDGATGPTGPTSLDSYVQTGNVATGLNATSTASCLGNDVALGGGYSTAPGVTVNVTQNAPVFVGTGPATGWTTTATLAVGETLTSYVICHDVE